MPSIAAVPRTGSRSLSAAWGAIIYSQPLQTWQTLPDEQLPIPQDFIATRAYHLFLARFQEAGNDWAHWFEAEKELRSDFRALVAREVAAIGEHAVVNRTGGPAKSPSPGDEEPIDQCAAHQVRAAGNAAGDTATLDKGAADCDKIDNMGGQDKNNLIREARESLRNYRGRVAEMTQRERSQYTGKLLAILCETGEIIAAAGTESELKAAVNETAYRDSAWRIMGGPCDAPPIAIEQLVRQSGEALAGR